MVSFCDQGHLYSYGMPLILLALKGGDEMLSSASPLLRHFMSKKIIINSTIYLSYWPLGENV